MDPVTHVMTNAWAARALRESPRRAVAMALLGLAPDLDFAFHMLPVLPVWLSHRSITHSFVGMIVQALLYAWLLSRWDRGEYVTRAFDYALALCLHSLLDMLTGFGVPLFLPFSFREVSGGLSPDIPLLPLAVMVIALMGLQKHRAHERRWLLAIFFSWMVYLSGMIYLKRDAERLAATIHPQTTVLPTKWNPFVWRAVFSDDVARQYHCYWVLLGSHRLEKINSYSFPPPTSAVLTSWQSPLLQRAQVQGEWLVARETMEGPRTIVEWGHLVFSAQGDIRSKVRITIDDQGKIISEVPIVNFWEKKEPALTVPK